MESVNAHEADVEIAELIKTPCCDSLVYSDKEQTILDLWRLEEEQRLEHALLETQSGMSEPDALVLSDDELDEELNKAEGQVLKARAAYTLRSRVIQQVLITDPTLRAVHTGGTVNALEQKLLGLINERDVLAMLNSTFSKDLFDTTQNLSITEKENINITASNAGIAQRMLTLASEAKAKNLGDIEDPDLKERIQTLDDQIQIARRHWRIMKSIVSAVVVNSGIAWAKDQHLRNLVLDNENEIC